MTARTIELLALAAIGAVLFLVLRNQDAGALTASEGGGVSGGGGPMGGSVGGGGGSWVDDVFYDGPFTTAGVNGGGGW